MSLPDIINYSHSLYTKSSHSFHLLFSIKKNCNSTYLHCLLQFIQWPLFQRIMIFENLTFTFVPAKVTLLWCGDLQSSTPLIHLLNLTLSLPTTNDQGYLYDMLMLMIKQLMPFWAARIHSVKYCCRWKSCIHQDKIQLC